MTPATSSSGLGPKTISHRPFQEAAAPRAAVLADSPVSTSIDQDTPSTNSTSQGSSSNVRQTYTPIKHHGKWTKDHPIANIIGDPSRSVSMRKKFQTDDMLCYFDAFLTSVEPKNFKQAMTEPSWIDAMQEEIHEFETLEVKTDEFGGILKNKARLVPQRFRQEEGINFEESFARVARIEAISFDLTLFTRQAENDLLLMSFFLGLQISQSPRGIFINQSKYAFEIVKKYGMLSSNSVDTPMVEKIKLDEDLQGKAVDATLYRGKIGSLMYLTSSRPDLIYAACLCARYQDTGMSLTAYADADHAGCQDTRRNTSGSA
ncbi:retrovirus-related pol polyprotein from transposon TNT 1-94 [Tanacetum coccineum]